MFYSNFLIGVVVQNDQTNVPIAAIPLHVLVFFALARIVHVQMEFVVQKVTARDGCNGTGTIEQVLHGIRRWRNMSRLGSQQRKCSFSNKFETTMHES
jgi:hypothetical protein